VQFRIIVKGNNLSKLIKAMPSFLREYRMLKKQTMNGPDDFPFGIFYPCIEERFQESGTASGHYFHQDLLVAGKIFRNNPVKHVDIGSRVDGFVSHIASFREIEVFDIRKLTIQIDNIIFKQADLMDPKLNLPDYCDSLSCLHALEHFGLGRYGDKIDYHGHLLGWQNIYNVLKRNGKLYFSVPIGRQRIEFNAHRVFSLDYLLKMMKDRYQIDSFSYVNDAGDLIKNADLNNDSIENNFSCHYGCGIFELTKC
jgi:SAM-dependent methyltransferase